jgi:hypothetical protein
MSQKIISYNPDLFNVSNTTKKRRTKENKPIRIKNPAPKNKSTRGKILRYIREQQEKNYKKLFEDSFEKHSKEGNLKNPLDETSDNEFENSVNYLKSIVDDEEKKCDNQSQSNTLKYRPLNESELFKSLNGENELKNNLQMEEQKVTVSNLPLNNFSLKPVAPPSWGCLKNGNLPTYRTYMHQTRKNNSSFIPVVNTAPILTSHIVNSPMINTPTFSPPVISPQIINTIVPTPFSKPIIPPSPPNIMYPGPNTTTQNETMKRISEAKQLREMISKKQNVKIPKTLKRKKTVKRTYYVGKSKVLPKVSVLVSNKTIRKKISTEAQLLKQTPIQDVKKFLVKKGFIKVGSTAPNDVLRKMYESAVLIGGEIQNYNPDNLLYNYLYA